MAGAKSILRRTWLGLVALTFISALIAEGVDHRLVLEIAVFSIAGAKAELLLSNFMEVDSAGPHWSRAFRVWVIAITLVMVVGHLL